MWVCLKHHVPRVIIVAVLWVYGLPHVHSRGRERDPYVQDPLCVKAPVHVRPKGVGEGTQDPDHCLVSLSCARLQVFYNEGGSGSAYAEQMAPLLSTTECEH